MRHSTQTFTELIAPMSINKVLVVVECLDPDGCDQPEIRSEIKDILDLGCVGGLDEWKDFLDAGFAVVEGPLSDENITEASLLIDFLRHQQFHLLLVGDLFINGEFEESSWEGDPSQQWIPKEKSATRKENENVVLHFPVDRIKRRKDSEH